MVNYVQRARDVRLLVNQEGMERGLLKAVERLCEDNEMLRQEMAAVVQTVNKMADIVANIATVGEKLKYDFEEVRKKFHREDLQ
jgi:nucleoid-associated protein YejK